LSVNHPGRSRLLLAVSLALLMLSSLALPVSAALQPAQADPAPVVQDISTEKCQGENACTGIDPATVGEGSCNGNQACLYATGPIGAGSCNDFAACRQTTGNIGNYSCNGDIGCFEATANIGDGSCNDGNACRASTGDIGNYSCNGNAACFMATANIGDCQHNAVTPAACIPPQPDGRIRRPGGPWLGDDIYNTSAIDQHVSVRARADRSRVLYISIQNDGGLADSFRLTDDQATSAGYSVRYFVGRTQQEISAAIAAGSWTTPSLAPGQRFLVRIWIALGPSVARYSSISRLVTISSLADDSKTDVVRYTVRRR
jgi:hypothetical protein